MCKYQFIIMQADFPLFVLAPATTEEQAENIAKQLDARVKQKRVGSNDFYADSPTFIRVVKVDVYQA